MSIWNWYYDYREQTLESPQCTDAHHQMIGLFEDRGPEPEEELNAIMQARQLAIQLNEDAFKLWCDAWAAMSLGDQNRLVEAYELLIESAVQSRQPKFDGMPQQIMVNVLFIGKMIDIDPAGHLEQIISGSDYIQSICDPTSEHLMVLFGNLAYCYLELKNPQAALPYINKQVELLPDNNQADYHAGLKRDFICIHYLLSEWDELLAHTDETLQLHGLSFIHQGEAHGGRACALLHLGSAKDAEREYNKCRRLFAKHPNERFFMYGSHFLEHSGQLQKAIELRLDQQERGKGMGRNWEMACGAKHLIELYRRSNQAEKVEEWNEELNQLCSKLKEPTALDAVVF